MYIAISDFLEEKSVNHVLKKLVYNVIKIMVAVQKNAVYVLTILVNSFQQLLKS